MNYALDQFILRGEDTTVVQGALSLYTYQNVGGDTATIQGSNDNITWKDIVTLASGAFSVQEHSYKYLRTSSTALVYVNRGEGNNTNDSSGGDTPPDPGQGGGGSYDFEVIDKDFSTNLSLGVIKPTFFAGASGTSYKSNGWDVTEQTSPGLVALSINFTQGRMELLVPPMGVFTVSPTKAESPHNVDLPQAGLPENILVCAVIEPNGEGILERSILVYNADLSPNIHTTTSGTLFIEYNNGKYDVYTETNVFIRSVGVGTNNKYLDLTSLNNDGEKSITYKPLTAKGQVLSLPSNLKEGIYYRSLSDISVGGFTFKTNDYVQFYSNNTKAIINRLPVLPVPPKQYFRGEFQYAQDINLSDTVVGDYAYISSVNALYMFDGNGWRPIGETQVVTYTADDIAETSNRKYLNSSNLVQYLDLVLDSFGVYVDLKATFDRRVHEAVSDIQIQPSGAFSKYFEEYVSVPTGIYSSRNRAVDGELAAIFDTTGGIYALSVAKSPLTRTLPISANFTNNSPVANRMQVFLLSVLAISEAAASKLEFVLYSPYPDPTNIKFTITIDKPNGSGVATGTFKSEYGEPIPFDLPELTELAIIIDKHELYVRTNGGLTLMYAYTDHVPIFSAALNIDSGFRFKSFSAESIEYLPNQ